MAGRRAASRAQVQDRRVSTEPPDAPAAPQIGHELAAVRIPSPVFGPSLTRKAFTVDGNPRDPISREQPRAVRGCALPLGPPDRHRWTDGTNCNETSEPAGLAVYEDGVSAVGGVFVWILRGGLLDDFAVPFRGLRRDLVGPPRRLRPPTASRAFARRF